MKLAIVGVGNAGSRIVNRILEVENASGRNLSQGNALLINTSRPEFDTTERVPSDRQLVIGDVHHAVNGHGTNGDPDLGAEVAQNDVNEIRRAFDLVRFYQIDGVLVVAGLGGGTGGGAGAVVLDEIQAICDKPVYALGVLPSEAEGGVPALNATRSLQSFVGNADNVIAFDNDAWRSSGMGGPSDGANGGATDGTADGASDGTADGTEEGATDRGEEPPDGTGEGSSDGAAEIDYEEVNRELATRVVTLFAAGEIEGPAVAENLMDPSDLIRTLDTGGISSIGYAATDARTPDSGVRSWLRSLPWISEWLPQNPERRDDDDDTTDAARIDGLVRDAVRSRLTLPCEISSAERALIMLSGPSRELSRKGFEYGRYWLEQEANIVEVMAGDEPNNRSSELRALVLFSNVTEVPRIDAMQRQALSAQAEATEPAAGGVDGVEH